MPAHIALVTWSGHPALTEDDGLAAAALAARGHRVDAAAWDDPRVRWERFDAIVLRSTWNYHVAFRAFSEWLSALPDDRRVWNPVPLVRWNADKGYLLELERAGVPIPPTMRVSAGAAPPLGDLLLDRGWQEAVVKPAVSADAHDTMFVTSAAAPARQAEFARIAVAGDVLVQRLVPEIRSDGELSLVFFNGRFSHAVRKRPANGDFRVQERFGGAALFEAVPAALVDTCGQILRHLPREPLYARVDGIPSASGFVLMEVELVEPTLFLALDPASADRFADALLARVSDRG